MYLENWGLAVLPCSGVADISTSLPRFLCYYVDFLGSTSSKIICWLIQVLKKSIKHEKGSKSFHKSCQFAILPPVAVFTVLKSEVSVKCYSVRTKVFSSVDFKKRQNADFFLCKCSKNSLKREVYSYLGKMSCSLR